ncbi:vestitone reductase isoform X2 [Solanum lycopersicum]
MDKPESFSTAIEGCVGVFHVAHPMNYGDQEIEEEKIRKAVDGTLGILRECLNSKTVKRVVYTSSRTAVVFNDKGLDTVDESSWSDIHVMKTLKPISAASYVISKTLAEKAALEFAEKHGLDLVTVIPSWIHGPFLSPQFPEPLRPAMAMMYGNQENSMKYPSLTPFVHVDDVANAHILLLENSKAKGRYICSAVEVTPDELFDFLSARYPEYRIPNVDSLREVGGIKHPSLSSKKLLDSGFKYKYGLEEMFDGAIECCKQKGLL